MSNPNRLMFIGCSKTKVPQTRKHLTPGEMYTGQLFKLRVAYAESRGIPWAVLSAKYGLFWPDTALPWYDQTFGAMCKLDVAAWHLGVGSHLLSFFDDDRVDPKKVVVELHAGKEYCEPLEDHLSLAGFIVLRPCEGLGIGEQLAWYKQHTKAEVTSA